MIWLCQFSNEELNSYFHTRTDELAPWLDHLLSIFKQHDDIELHIVMPNIFNNSDCMFEIEAVKFHLFKYEWNNRCHFPRRLYNVIKYLAFVYLNITLPRIKKIINEIKPDLIHLHGVEMPRFSVGVLPFVGKYPILVTIAGFISRTTLSSSKIIQKQISIEKKILSRCTHFGVRTNDSIEYIQRLNPTAVFHHHQYPYKIPTINLTASNLYKREFDFVFFSRVCVDKGVEDLLLAMSKVVRKYPASRLLIIGKGEPIYLNHLREKCTILKIQNNVVFAGFLASQDQVHELASKAKICVHPSYHDILPGPVIESMCMGLAVITYDVGGISILNEKKESITLIPRGNVDLLGDEMLNLLTDKVRMKKQIENAKSTVQVLYNNEELFKTILGIYRKILLEC